VAALALFVCHGELNLNFVAILRQNNKKMLSGFHADLVAAKRLALLKQQRKDDT
jgi:hypothetical protein